jgi:subtilisin family serine protease
MKKIINFLLALSIGYTTLGQSFQPLAKNHVAKKNLYAYVTHYFVKLEPHANKTRLLSYFESQNLIVDNNSGAILAGGNSLILIAPKKPLDRDIICKKHPQDISYISPVIIENNTLFVEGIDFFIRTQSQTDLHNYLKTYLSTNIISLSVATAWDSYRLRIENMEYYDEILTYLHQNKNLLSCREDRLLPKMTNAITPPTDQFFVNQYYLANNNGININALGGWYYTKGSPTIRVAVLDDGVEAHEDLEDTNGNSRVLSGYTPAGTASFGTSIGGEPTAICTSNIINSNIAMIGHGQACAGIIAASHNSIGIAGIAPQVKIVPVNIFARAEFGSTLGDMIDGLMWAADNADILSNSWAIKPSVILSPSDTQALKDAIYYAVTTKGRVVVFSSGNEGLQNVSFPNAEPGVISVGALGRDNQLGKTNFGASTYSNTGADLDLVAFGGHLAQGFSYYGNCTKVQTADIYTTDRMGDAGYSIAAPSYLATFGGTSAACPQVAGAAALLLSVNPQLTYTQVAGILTASATKINGQADFDTRFGYGRLNIGAALESILGNLVGDECIPIGVNQTQYTVANTLNSPYFQNYPVTWTSTGALSIDNTGLATVVGNGYAKITATITTPNGTLSLDKEVWAGTFNISATQIQASRGAICADTEFSLNDLPLCATVVWTTSNNNLVQILDPNSAKTTIRPLLGRGYVTITATIYAEKNGIIGQTRTKTIWAGDINKATGFNRTLVSQVNACEKVFRYTIRGAEGGKIYTYTYNKGLPDEGKSDGYIDVTIPYGSTTNFTLYVEITKHCPDKEKPFHIPFVNPVSFSVANPLIPPGQPACMARVGQTKSSFVTFPNPTSGIINLSFDNLNQGIATISISNNLGIQVLQNQNITLDKDNSTAINLSNLADGIYFLTVSFADGSQETRKIVLQKGNIAD